MSSTRNPSGTAGAQAPAKARQKRTFLVGYALEEGFTVEVDAYSAAQAKAKVRRLLDRDADELAGSERVHFDAFVCDVEEVRS